MSEKIVEYQRGDDVVTTDAARISVEQALRLLRATYWATDLSHETRARDGALAVLRPASMWGTDWASARDHGLRDLRLPHRCYRHRGHARAGSRAVVDGVHP